MFAPGVTIDVIAPQFPKPGLIAFEKLKSVDPFCGFPEVEMRH